MGYGQIIQMVDSAIRSLIASNQISKAVGGYSAQLEKFKRVEPIEPGQPHTVDWESGMDTAIGANLNTAVNRNRLGRQTNTFNINEQKRTLRSMQPWFDTLQDQIGKNAASYSKGELPSDVVSSIGRAASSRGLSSGFGQGARGGGNGTSLGNLNLRNLGLTSLELSKYGTNTAMQANQMAKYLSPQLFDPASFMVTPQQGIGYDFQNAGIENEADRYLNELLNRAEWDNISIANTANQLSASGKLAGRLAGAQILGSSSGGGGGGGGGMSMGSFGGGGGGGGGLV